MGGLMHVVGPQMHFLHVQMRRHMTGMTPNLNAMLTSCMFQINVSS